MITLRNPVDGETRNEDPAIFEPPEGAVLDPVGPDGPAQVTWQRPYEGWDVIATEGPIDDAAVVEHGVRVVPLTVRQERVCLAIAAEMMERRRLGYAPTTGPLAGHRLQLRDKDDEDNWRTLQNACMAQVILGNGSQSGAIFRTADNENVTTSWAVGLQETLKMLAWGQASFKHCWDLKDAARASDEPEAIDIEEGWP